MKRKGFGYGIGTPLPSPVDSLTKTRKEDRTMGNDTCGYGRAWIGPCEDPTPCEKHKDLVCCSCGALSTHECAETGQFVCGCNLCDDCEHAIFPDGTNGGIGFNAAPLPDDLPPCRHVKKTEQKYTPWYTREPPIVEVQPKTPIDSIPIGSELPTLERRVNPIVEEAKISPCPLCGEPSKNDNGWGCSDESCEAHTWAVHHCIWVQMSKRVGFLSLKLEEVIRARDYFAEKAEKVSWGGKLTMKEDGSFILVCHCGGEVEGKVLTPGVLSCPDCGLPFEFELVGLTRLIPLAETPDGVYGQMMDTAVRSLDKPPKQGSDQ